MNITHAMRAITASFVLAVTIAPAAQAQQRAGALVIENAWAAATNPGATVAAGYVTVRNTGAEPERLLSASSPRADRAEIHEMSMANGVMRMRPVSSVTIPAGGAVTLSPSGMHIMFIDIDAPFAPDSRIPVTLHFERQGDLDVQFVTRAPGSHAGHSHDH